jgi:serine/threonine protein kinase
MAEVFKAKTFGAEGFERLVAIKRILSHLVEDDDFVNMFIDEAKIAVRLQHPNIVGIHDLGRAGGTLYIAMEFVPGRDVRAIYDFEQERDGATPIGVACHIVMKMCEALHHAHFATGPRGEPLQVIHRDVSPQNVLISFDGEVKVADFGLAKARGRMVQTQAGVVKGKLAYMSPEQLRGDDIDHRVDVFGLGIVLFELLSGRRLFLGASDMDTLRAVYEARVPPMQELNPDVHPDLEVIVRRALAKNRDERYATALDLHDDLQTFAYGHGCYAGAAALRSYLREVFPDVAPPPENELPPFSLPPPAVQAPPAPPRPTYRPPSRSEIVPPALGQRASAPVPERVAGPSLDDLYQESSMLLDPIEQSVLVPGPAAEGPATERPPAPAVVVTQRVIATGAPPPPEHPVPEHPVPEHPVPEHSGTVPASVPRLPSEPLGLYDDDWPTGQVHPAALDIRQEPGFDTSPAPAPDTPFPVMDWDDGPTMHTPLNAPPPTDLLESSWDDDQTVVISDPKRSHGS